MSRIFILDPSLSHQRQHHFYAMRAFLSEAESLGLEPKVFAQRWASRAVHRLGARRHFSTGGYSVQNHGAAELDKLAKANYRTLVRLRKLRSQIKPDDFVFFPAITAALAMGVCQWISGFEPQEAPRFGMCLMFQPDWHASGGRSDASDAYNRHAFGLIPHAIRHRVAYTCETEGLANEYAPIVGSLPLVLPLPTFQFLLDDHVKEKRGGHPPRVAFLGYTKSEKGALQITDILAKAEERYGELDFTVQIMGGSKALGASIEKAASALRKAPKIIRGSVVAEQMIRILSDTDILLLPYDPSTYRTRGSALFTEAKSLGVPMVISRDTAIGREAAEKGIGIGIADFNAESTLSALGEALERLPELIKASAVEAKRIRAEDPGYLKPLFFEKLSAEG
ncbi:MAG: hypothetical protein CL917_17875 [Deltaproteobacteria bacterium]|nr:hypothetical protein [Deltaproteobacteria bacterium]